MDPALVKYNSTPRLSPSCTLLTPRASLEQLQTLFIPRRYLQRAEANLGDFSRHGGEPLQVLPVERKNRMDYVRLRAGHTKHNWICGICDRCEHIS